jgi:1-aminocyclopropane-1-carboxylate deaminase/D-cysteine desulfhydrase-like pyridoxal-dependent ACC family enzyme
MIPITDLPLFTRYPILKQQLEPQRFACLPTPVKALSGLGSNAWIKQDDLTHPDYGGNKIRKLDFILADIKRNHKNHVITFGATGTNAGVASAMMCYRNQLKCTVYLFEQPLTQTVKDNIALMQAYGAELIFCGSLLKTVLSFYGSRYRLNRNSYFLWAGCSNSVATFAYINAAFELKQQIEEGLLPEPEHIFVPVGSCSTLAGLTLGVKLCGLNSKVVGIRVAPAYLGPFPACTEGEVNKVIKQAAKQMQKWGIKELGNIPTCYFSDNFYGEGYGIASEESLNAIDTFKAQGITLENTYSGKAAAAFLQQLHEKNKEHGKPQLFWQTFNSADSLGQIKSGHPIKESDNPQPTFQLSTKIKAYLASK